MTEGHPCQKLLLLGAENAQNRLTGQKIDFFKVRDIDTPIQPRTVNSPPQDNRLLKSNREIGCDLRFDFLGTIPAKEKGDQTSKFLSIFYKKTPTNEN